MNNCENNESIVNRQFDQGNQHSQTSTSTRQWTTCKMLNVSLKSSSMCLTIKFQIQRPSSIQTLKIFCMQLADIIAYLVWVLISFLNVPAAILTFVAARKSKAKRGTTTNAFLQQANFCITIASISFSTMGIVHISNWYFGIPETQCRYACFIRISHQSFLFSLANTFILVMAVDRFFAMKCHFSTFLISTKRCNTFFLDTTDTS
uniref:G-protein coupled receptors family 1 profile domain-containing protein n=1 Tax=Romanomermis culicivorax TaxID=13658 RepID=A0A915L870_ROMCU